MGEIYLWAWLTLVTMIGFLTLREVLSRLYRHDAAVTEILKEQREVLIQIRSKLYDHDQWARMPDEHDDEWDDITDAEIADKLREIHRQQMTVMEECKKLQQCLQDITRKPDIDRDGWGGLGQLREKIEQRSDFSGRPVIITDDLDIAPIQHSPIMYPVVGNEVSGTYEADHSGHSDRDHG